MSMKVRSLDGADTTLTGEHLDDLKARLRGPLLVPGDAGYEDSRTVWNAMIDRRPAMVVRCLGVWDVVAAVRFAREHRLLVTIKGGGHNISGLAVHDGAIMLDMSLMRGVFVDREARIAHAQAGCLLGDVDRETQLHGLAAVLGFVSNTGIAGLTVGGGFGYLSRRYGWTSDNVVSMDVVTADGTIVRASEKENADLFWGLRGGGGNFGIVTDFAYKLYPVGPEVYAGVIAWPLERAEEVLETVRKMGEAAPPELTMAALLRLAPPAPWLSKDIHGKPMVGVAACHVGPVEDGERALAPLKAIAGAVGDVMQRRTYVSQQCLLDATQPKGRRYYWKSEYLPGLDPKLLSQIVQHARNGIPSPHSALIVFQIGGAIGDLPNEHSAVGNRDAKWLYNITSSWDQAADDRINVDYARAVWKDLKPFSTGGTYMNFLTEEESGDRIESAFGANFDRLSKIKTKWDPDNFFRANKNIVPVPAA